MKGRSRPSCDVYGVVASPHHSAPPICHHDCEASSSACPSLAPSGRVAHFFLNSFSASCQTRAFLQSFSCSRLGSRALLKASDASRGRSDGR